MTGCRRSCCRSRISRSSVGSLILSGCRLALSEFYILDDDLLAINHPSVFVCIIIILDASLNHYLRPLMKVLFNELTLPPEGDARKEVCVLLAVSLESAVNRNSESCDCRRILSRRVADFRISYQTSH